MSPQEIRTVASWLGAVLGVACLVCLAIAFAFGPDAIAAGVPLEALGITPRPCPGCPLCGLSRGFAHASEGSFREAIALNPAVVALYPAFWLVGVGGPAYAWFHLRRSAR